MCLFPRDRNVMPLPLNPVKDSWCGYANLSKHRQFKCLPGELPVWTWGVSVPSNGMEKIIFPRLIFFSLMIELIYAHCRKLGGL